MFLDPENHIAGIQEASPKPKEIGLFQDIPGWIWRIFFSAWATIFLLFLVVFTTNASATFVVTISALTGLMMLGRLDQKAERRMRQGHQHSYRTA